MTYEEFTNKTREILTKLESPEEIGAIIDELTAAYRDRDTAVAEAEQKVAELTKKNELLQKSNMELFLRTGVQGKPDDLAGVEEEKGVDFSELFGDDGEIK